MYPLGMDPLMRELCKFHEKLWRKDHPEHDSDIYAVEIAKAFLQSAAERGLARLVEDADGHLIWEATPKRRQPQRYSAISASYVRLSFSVHHRTTRNRRIALKKTNALCR